MKGLGGLNGLETLASWAGIELDDPLTKYSYSPTLYEFFIKLRPYKNYNLNQNVDNACDVLHDSMSEEGEEPAKIYDALTKLEKALMHGDRIPELGKSDARFSLILRVILGEAKQKLIRENPNEIKELLKDNYDIITYNHLNQTIKREYRLLRAIGHDTFRYNIDMKLIANQAEKFNTFYEKGTLRLKTITNITAPVKDSAMTAYDIITRSTQHKAQDLEPSILERVKDKNGMLFISREAYENETIEDVGDLLKAFIEKVSDTMCLLQIASINSKRYIKREYACKAIKMQRSFIRFLEDNEFYNLSRWLGKSYARMCEKSARREKKIFAFNHPIYLPSSEKVINSSAAM